MRKNTYLISLIALLIPIFGFAQKGSIKIAGNDFCTPLMRKLTDAYIKKTNSANFSIVDGSTKSAFEALRDETAEIVQSSDRMNVEEKLKLQESGHKVREIKLAYEAVVVIVNTRNKIMQLSREQLEYIFSGKYTNWKQLGGDDVKIVLYSCETSSENYSLFKDQLMTRKNLAPTTIYQGNTNAMLLAVSQNRGAIGFINLSRLDNKNAKAIKISFDKKNYVAATSETILDNSYPIYKTLFLYYLGVNDKKIKNFVSYITSDDAKQIISDEGYIPIQEKP